MSADLNPAEGHRLPRSWGFSHATGPLSILDCPERLSGVNSDATTGPFAETETPRGEFSLIDARGLDDAIQVASTIPPGRLGSVEVRPILSSSSRSRDGRMS
jgi:hypothetical protein